VRGWIGRFESAGQCVAERLSHLGNDLGAFVTVEHVLDKRPLQCVAGPATQGIDAVAAVRAAHQQGERLGRDVGPNVEALVADCFVELEVLALESGDEHLKRAVGVGASKRGDLVRDIRREQPGTPDQHPELRPLFTYLLQPTEQPQQSTRASWGGGAAETAQRPYQGWWALRRC
jgi:hypothetical protein